MNSADFAEVLRVTKLIEWHLSRMYSPPRPCGSVMVWENTEAQSIARLSAELSTVARRIIRQAAQREIDFPQSCGNAPMSGSLARL